ncbi:MAG: hypothetical protein AAGF26_09245 [Cyanobacteria bacterium P01_G01_bin.49]
MDNYNSESSFSNESDSDTPTVDQANTDEVLRPEILPDHVTETPDLSTEAIAVSVVSDDESPLDRDWFNLARKLRGQNRELLETIVKLEQELAQSKQQFQEQTQRSRQLCEQTNTIQTTQAQNNSLIEQLQTCQQATQHQQLAIETLQKQLTKVQRTFAQLERECTLVKEECHKKTHQLAIAQEQVRELNARLKRQQRYTLQYKAALDECLSNCAKKVPTSALTVPSNLAPSVVSIQPWSSQLETESSSFPESEIDSIDQTLEELFSRTDSLSETIEEQGTDDNLSSDHLPQAEDFSNEMILSSSQSLVVNSPVPFSFSIDRSKKEEAAKAKVDLPSFLRRH